MLQSKFITGEGRIQKPHNSYDVALCNICKRLKTIDYYRKVLYYSDGRVNGSFSDNELSRLLKGLLFLLFNLRSINKHEQIGEKFERNEKLNSVDFYNFDRKSCILISFVLNPLMSNGNKRPYILKQTCSF